MWSGVTYLRDVLAGQLSNDLLETLAVGLDADSGQEVGHVLSGGAGVATRDEQEVCGDVLHGDKGFKKRGVEGG